MRQNDYAPGFEPGIRRFDSYQGSQMWKVIRLPCGHDIEERGKWCPACTKLVGHIKYGSAGVCPTCDKRYPIDRYNFYRGKT